MNDTPQATHPATHESTRATTRPSVRRQPATETWVTAVQRFVVRELIRWGQRHAVDAADDVAQEVVVALLAVPDRLEAIVERYPEPAVYARVRARHAFTQWERAMRADRGEGARLVCDADGQLHAARTVVAGDAPLPGGEGDHWGLVGGHDDPTDDLVDLLSKWGKAVEFIDGLAPTDREIVVLVLGFGYQVTEVAARLGIARETAARRLSRIRRQIDAWRANMEAEMSAWADDERNAG